MANQSRPPWPTPGWGVTGLPGEASRGRVRRIRSTRESARRRRSTPGRSYTRYPRCRIAQQGHRANRGVPEPPRCRCGRVGQVGRRPGPPLVGGGDLAQPATGPQVLTGAALRVSFIRISPSSSISLNENGTVMMRPVELRHRHLAGHVQRRQAVVVGTTDPRMVKHRPCRIGDVQRQVTQRSSCHRRRRPGGGQLPRRPAR